MSAHNPNGRLEMFSDGVIAIAITLLIIEIKVPHVSHIHSVKELWQELAHMWPSWFGFTLSFGSILIAWVNHHSFMKYLDKSSNTLVYATGFFLLTIVVMPFTTALMAEYMTTPFAKPGIVVYCFGAMLHNVGWLIIFRAARKPVLLAKSDYALKKMTDGQVYVWYGFVFYMLTFIVSFWLPIVALTMLSVAWVAWLLIGIVFYKEEEAPDVISR